MRKIKLKSLSTKQRAALLSICSNFFLIVLKFIVGILTGSISILSEAAHSFSDLIASFVAFISVRISSTPADDDHHYGHGKFEDLSGLIQGALILLTGSYIVYEATEKIYAGSFEEIKTTAGIIVMIISCIINFLVSCHLFKVADKTNSIAIFADAEHLRVDIYTSLGVLFGLILIRFTNLPIIDPIIAIIISLLVIKAGLDICENSFKNLLDTSLPKKEVKKIKKIVKIYTSDEILEIRKLKTRKSGGEKQIELTILVPANLTIKQGHEICNKIEKKLEKDLKNSTVIIHLEPCNKRCKSCSIYHKKYYYCLDNKF